MVDDVIRNLCELWKQIQDTVLSRLRIATVKVKTNSQLAKLIKNTIDELEKVKQLDPEKLRIAVSGTPGEVVVNATRKKLWHRLSMRTASLLKEKFRRLGTVEVQRTPATPPPVSHPPPPVACPEPSVANGITTPASPDTNFPGLEVAMLPTSMAKTLRASVSELQGSDPTSQQIADAARGDSSDEGVEDRGSVKLTQEVLRKCVLATSLEPLMTRVKAGAQSSMEASLNEMGALAQQAVLGALEEHRKDIERQLRVQGSEDYQQSRAETLDRLTCWGNLVAAQGAIKKMKEMWKEPVVQVTSPSSTLLVALPGSSSPSLRSPSPSITIGSLHDHIFQSNSPL